MHPSLKVDLAKRGMLNRAGSEYGESLDGTFAAWAEGDDLKRAL
jgi:hypothetical protein